MVSIIIPVYNRAWLINETLDSIIAQTYQNWECIVVDDRSTDNTLQLLNQLSEKEDRIKYFTRPENRTKGANSCRNLGFEKSTGDYVIWFDSDDLMTPDHIESKLNLIQEVDLDFVVARTQNFENDRLLEPYKYNKKEYGIKAADFILLKIHWYTYDVLMKREIVEKISWNEAMKSWQDYNYFCKMLVVTENGDYLDQILTHRRLHSQSIQKSLTKTRDNFNIEMLDNRVLNYQDISKKTDALTQKELLFGMMNLCFELSKFGNTSFRVREVTAMVKKEFGFKSTFYFQLALFSGGMIGKGHYFLDKAKKR